MGESETILSVDALDGESAGPDEIDALEQVWPIPQVDPDDPRFETADDPRMPDGQSFFKIGEVARLIGVPPYVLRFWETEFSWVRPEKTSAKQRRYRRQDVAALFTIRRLRYDAQLTIKRTRDLIRDDKKRGGGNLRRIGIGPTQLMVSPIEAGPGLGRRLAEMRAAVLELLESVESEGG